MEKEIKICGYRNCGKEIGSDRRPKTKFCNNKCRINERTYIRRAKLKLLKEMTEQEFFIEKK